MQLMHRSTQLLFQDFRIFTLLLGNPPPTSCFQKVDLILL